VHELKAEVERRSRLCEQLDMRLKEVEKAQIRERETGKMKLSECKTVIEGLTERVRALKKELKVNKVG
jgi:hypothetical protein